MSKIFSILAAALIGLAAQSIYAQPQAAETPVARAAGDEQLQWGACPEFIPKGCEIAVLHGDPSKPNADIFFKVPAGFTVPSHWHTSAERMVLVSGEMTVTYEGQPPTTLESGMYAYGPPKLPHVAVCGEGEACVLFIAFEEPVDAVATEE